MKERPIIFSGPMVQAILEDRKFQTRRVVKPQPKYHPPRSQGGSGVWWWRDRQGWAGDEASPSVPIPYCPYGAPGDHLWVRETWAVDDALNASRPRDIPRDSEVVYSATGAHGCAMGATGKWRPSIFLLRWASRLSLDVTGVRVERVQDIGEDDAVAEGCGHTNGSPYFDGGRHPVKGTAKAFVTARDAFADLWDSISGGKPGRTWDDNPWVGVVDFERVQEEEARGAA